jgi:hypothetical protein
MAGDIQQWEPATPQIEPEQAAQERIGRAWTELLALRHPGTAWRDITAADSLPQDGIACRLKGGPQEPLEDDYLGGDSIAIAVKLAVRF